MLNRHAACPLRSPETFIFFRKVDARNVCLENPRDRRAARLNHSRSRLFWTPRRRSLGSSRWLLTNRSARSFRPDVTFIGSLRFAPGSSLPTALIYYNNYSTLDSSSMSRKYDAENPSREKEWTWLKHPYGASYHLSEWTMGLFPNFIEN